MVNTGDKEKDKEKKLSNRNLSFVEKIRKKNGAREGLENARKLKFS